MRMDVIFRIFMKNGLVEVKIPLCAAGGFPSLQTRVTSVNTLPGGGCGFLKCASPFCLVLFFVSFSISSIFSIIEVVNLNLPIPGIFLDSSLSPFLSPLPSSYFPSTSSSFSPPFLCLLFFKFSSSPYPPSSCSPPSSSPYPFPSPTTPSPTP